ncbi:hypothetical protein ABXT08_19490 [Chryseobacterium sp. NRRL B-14859]|uniref:hypothetical protein n=1 Tax=Chryseobacterium sp. NRRL B-14859 TaxID=1562763 RepID=UPI003397156E
MKDQHIVYIGKLVFGSCFLLGNIGLFGYLITKNADFDAQGFHLLFFGAAVTLLIVLMLLVYSVIDQSKSDACLKAIGILMLNIPIAIIYAIIELNDY